MKKSIVVLLALGLVFSVQAQNKKNLKKESGSLENNQIKDFVNKINEETRNKKR